jgi:hypothetical protein
MTDFEFTLDQDPEIVETDQTDSPDLIEESDNDNIDSDYDFTPLYNFYKEEGFLPEKEDFKGTADEFVELLTQTMQEKEQQLHQHVLSNLPDKYRTIVDLAMKGAVSEEQIHEFLTPNSDTLAPKDYLIEYYTSLNWSTKRINNHIESLEEDEELEEHYKEIKEAQDKITSKQNEERLQAIQAQYEEKVKHEKENEEKFFSYVSKLPIKERTEITEMVKKNEVANKLQEIIANPQAFVQLAFFLKTYDGQKFKIEDPNKKMRNTLVKAVSTAKVSQSSQVPEDDFQLILE